MAETKIPVSFDFFKKHTYYEECVEFMLKLVSRDNKKMYEACLNNASSKERALRAYYEAFYLKPKIREKYHIRIKPIPMKVKEKLLVIPELDTDLNREFVTGVEKKDVCEKHAQDAKSIGDNNGSSGTFVLKKQSVGDARMEDTKSRVSLDVCEDQLVQDDKEPVKSPIKKEDGKLDRSGEKHRDKAEVAQLSEVNTSSSSNTLTSTSTLIYKKLVPYMHCCPVTFKEFRRNSNICDLLREFGKKKNLNDDDQRVVLQRSYLLFYLAPEHRNMAPINKIQLLDHCAPNIREKFFNIPTKLYLKEPKNENDIKEIKKNHSSEATAVCAVTNSTTELQQKSTKNNEVKGIQANANPTTTPLNISPAEINSENVVITKYTATNNCIKINDNIGEQIVSVSIAAANKPFVKLPVTIEEFKKYTNYEEIVEELFKILEGNNNNAYSKHKSSQEVLDNILENYYRAFYLLPAIRKIWPIRIKPVPNCVKDRLLKVPECENVTSLSNFKVEQLVSPELYALIVDKQESIKKHSDELPKGKEASLSDAKASAVRMENCTQNLASNEKNSDSTGTKRSSNEASRFPSPKRQKIHQIEKHDEAKPLYKLLLPYAHCCPVSFAEFWKYTNASELYRNYCLKRYNGIEKLPYVIQRVYLLYYLSPKHRYMKPLNNLKVLDACPMNLRDKILKIPENLHLKAEYTNETERQSRIQKQIPQGAEVSERINEPNLTREAATRNDEKENNTSGSNLKQNIEILENRLLPPITFPSSFQSREESKCSCDACIFHHLSHLDFIKLTNDTGILPQHCDIRVIRNAFKGFIYKVIKDDNYTVNGVFMCKVIKYNYICENCENDIKISLNLNSAFSSRSDSVDDRSSNATAETVIERAQSRLESETNKEGAAHHAAIDKSSIARQANSSPNDIVGQLKAGKISFAHLSKCLWSDKMFSKFCKKLLAKLNQAFDSTADFCPETYKIFLNCNEIPLRKLLNDCYENTDEDIIQRILNEKELVDALKRHYYIKYLTNANFALKYPTEMRQTDSEEICNKIKEKEIDKSEGKDDNDLDGNKTQNTNIEKTNLPKATGTLQTLTQNDEPLSIINNALEKAKRIFFRNVEKFNTLSYVLRTSFGAKQVILCNILDLTFDEFLEITDVYEGNELYADKHVAECMYRYVFCSPFVWPTNLYIPLDKLIKFLHKKNISFDDYSTMLKLISPKLLHWSNLLPCTNILKCVAIDFENRTGKILDTNDTGALKQECIEYYDRCWKYEKWLGKIPIVSEEFLQNFWSDNTEVLNEVVVEQVSEEPTKDGINASNLDSRLTEVEPSTSTSTKSDHPIKEFNYVILPNTQQQIEMLPAEEILSTDPLNKTKSAFEVNISSSSEESCETETLGELTQTIKTESIAKKLLSNLKFWENESGNFYCIPQDEEIVNIDDSTLQSEDIEEDLPPSEIEFEICINDDLINSSLDFQQYLSSLGESDTATTVDTQQFMQQPQTKQLTQYKNITFKNSGEDKSYENIHTKQPQDSEDQDHHHPSHTYLESQCVLNSSKDIQTYSGALSVEHAKHTIKQHPIRNSSSHASTSTKVGLPLRSAKTKTFATKKIKNIAKVQPLNRLDLVPQIQHNTRPLQTVPIRAASSGTCSQEMRQPFDNLAPTSIMLTLTPNSSSSSSGQSSQNSNFQLQLSPSGTHIYISQELNKNCSIFDNCTLLRIADHNYCKQTASNLPSAATPTRSGEAPSCSNTIRGQQPLSITSNINQQLNQRFARTNPIDAYNNSLANEVNTQDFTNILTQQNVTNWQSIEVNAQPACRTSLFGTNDSTTNADTNAKVNTLTVIQTDTIPIRISNPIPQAHHHSYRTVRKFCLYREIIAFHYFKELTCHHISQYLLPSLEIGKSYSEALVVSDNFKTRISNRSISALFPFWPQNLQRDFILILNDLKEFHYVVFERASMQKQEDLRVRILFWLLNTAPFFSHCQFVYQENNTEFSHCEPIKNGNNTSYERKPFKCLTNALSPKVLGKLKQIKQNLNKGAE